MGQITHSGKLLPTMLVTVHGVASTMRQREAGAVQPLARKALVITEYVLEGKRANRFQFQAAS